MKRLFSTLLFITVSLAAFAQDFWQGTPLLHYSNDGGSRPLNAISVYGNGNYGSDALNNAFIGNLYKGGYIDSTFIARSADRLLPDNRFGMSAETGIYYKRKTADTTDNFVTISLRRRTNLSGTFSDDAFRLAFQGNTRFKGETADFGGTGFRNMSWTEMQVGYGFKINSKISMTTSLSLLAGHKYNEVNVETGTLYTDSRGLFLDANVKADYFASDTAQKNNFALNGWGTSANIGFTYVKVIGESKWYAVNLGILDAGFIQWNNNTIHRSADTSFRYSGADITQTFTNPDYVAELPEVNDYIHEHDKASKLVLLPTQVRINYTRMLNSRYIFMGTLSMPLNSYALPFGKLMISRSILKNQSRILSGITYGGYARLQVPLTIQFYKLKNTMIEAGMTNIIVFIKPEVLSGNGAFLKLNYVF